MFPKICTNRGTWEVDSAVGLLLNFTCIVVVIESIQVWSSIKIRGLVP